MPQEELTDHVSSFCRSSRYHHSNRVRRIQFAIEPFGYADFGTGRLHDGDHRERRVHADDDGVWNESADDLHWDDDQLVQQRQHVAYVDVRWEPVVVWQHPARRPVQLYVPIGRTVYVSLPDPSE